MPIVSLRGPLWPAVLWSIIVVVLLSVPTGTLQSSDYLEWDKVVHFGLFFVMTWLWLVAAGHRGRGMSLLILAAAIAFAFASEWYQHLLPVRSMDVHDAVADSAGSVAAWTLWAYLMWRDRNVRHGSPRKKRRR
ncbi:MAG: hypothetical protein COV99_06715 [Bacteroidetes bacterium CG12_big_fil_rev_8_21_14_0_65_60_17]|nr:MAG: hypothetical protein COV99_06715 [Bacteroidetes bacterium CG12_big_fil_rev_8_21_14_0_65_60_17]